MFKDNGRIVYQNSKMECERQFCGRVVDRVYQPFCDRCFRNRTSNSFQSRDGRSYDYNGQRWAMVEKEVEDKREIEVS